jgi:general secretion pathway protein M
MFGNILSKLDDRERLVVIGFVFFLILLIFINIGIRIWDFRSDLTTQVNEIRSNSNALEKAIQDYNYYRSLKSGEEEKISDTFSKLDQILNRYSLKEKIYNQRDYTNIVEKQYNRTSIEFTFKSVVLQDVMKMIYDIEVNKQVSGKVTNLNFRKVPMPGKELYDVTLRVSSYSKITPKKNG